MNSLNIKQQQLVEDNHNLIYSFAHSRQINLEEFYGLLAIALCKAALIFDESKGMFSTLAYRCMDNEINIIKRKEFAQKAIPKNMTDSLDYVYTSDDDNHETAMHEILIKDSFPAPDDNVINVIMFNNFYHNSLNQREKRIVNLLLQNKKQTTIGEEMSISQAQVSRLISIIRIKWNKFNR